ncbi:hypothetical protein EZV62_007922 [Acer yangbiense]|uniref:C2H2-type domain-containing protein n=1 Tax=Acer yangbiense TaxID=1000413 RepID=A0A5C7IBQ1_9ROSI|nr:hypothetical protein EZV62_007922 [Acer yangbiense]
MKARVEQGEPVLALWLSNNVDHVVYHHRHGSTKLELNLLGRLETDSSSKVLESSTNVQAAEANKAAESRLFICKYCDKKHLVATGHQNAHKRERAALKNDKQLDFPKFDQLSATQQLYNVSIHGAMVGFSNGPFHMPLGVNMNPIVSGLVTLLNGGPEQESIGHNLLCNINNFWEDFRRLNGRAVAVPGVSEMIIPSWRPPNIGLFKVNTDVATDSTRLRVGTGAIIRNSNGDVLASCA